ncbi:MAG: bile acid:sodium symporter [Desulfobulbus propionicus]|nr:MAG: bile acid:sodium symporter [Desulfobulbus propionicus]
MRKILRIITKNLTIAIPVMMLAGFLFGILNNTAFLKAYIVPFTFLMVYPMMVTLNIQKVFEGGDLKAQVLTQVINFAIVPFLAFGIGIIFFKDNPYMALGLLLAGLVPTSGMTISWTGFAGGNLEAAVKMTVIGLTLGSIATPFYVQFLMGTTIEINMGGVFKQIVLIVFIPMLAGFLTRRYLVRKHGPQKFKQSVAPKFPPLSTSGVIGIVFIAMALKAKAIAAAPGMLLYILAPLTIIYIFNFILSSLVGKFFLPRGDAIALVYGSVMRNLSIALAIAINAFGKEGASAALVVAVAYIIQVQAAAWYVKFTDKIFGSPETGTQPAGDGKRVKTESDPKEPGQMQGDENEEGAGESFIQAGFSKILFATDMSDTAKYAAQYACSIGNQYKADVWVIHVVPDTLAEFSVQAGVDLTARADDQSQQTFNQADVKAAEKRLKERIRTVSEKVLEQIPNCPLSEDRVIISIGDPVEEIVNQAQSGGFDLVVMGTHGHRDISDIILGSTATGVMETSSIPVFVARPDLK